MRPLVLAALLLSPYLTASAQYVVTAREDHWACKDKGVMEAVKETARSEDRQAITGAAVHLGVLTDCSDCFEYSEGDRLQFLDSEILSGYTVVREPASLGRYHTFRDLLGRPVQETLAPLWGRATARTPPARGDGGWTCKGIDEFGYSRQAPTSVSTGS